MAQGRPLLYIGPRGSTPHQIIQRYNCGWQIDCGDSASLIELLRLLQQNRDLIQRAGKAARKAFDANLARPLGVGHIADALEAWTRAVIETPVRLG